MWGTYWVWDARLTSVLVLFLMYLGVIALWRTVEDPSRAGRAAAILTLVGAINMPIIKFSVDWWNTLHQPASVVRLGGPAIHPTILMPLLVMAVAFVLLFLTLHLAAMRNEILRRRVRTLRLLQAQAARASVTWAWISGRTRTSSSPPTRLRCWCMRRADRLDRARPSRAAASRSPISKRAASPAARRPEPTRRPHERRTGQSRASPRRRLIVLLPLAVFLALAALFLFRLGSGDPSQLPSALIGRPVPRHAAAARCAGLCATASRCRASPAPTSRAQ